MIDDLPNDDPNPPCCPSCGVAYVDHLGLHGTCAVMLEFHAALEASRAEVQQLRAEVQRKKDIDPDADRARRELLDGYEDVLREAGVAVSGNPDEAAGQTHYDLGWSRMHLALAPLLTLRAYLDCTTREREAEYHAMDPADQERVTRFGSECVQAGQDGADEDLAEAESEVQQLRAIMAAEWGESGHAEWEWNQGYWVRDLSDNRQARVSRVDDGGWRAAIENATDWGVRVVPGTYRWALEAMAAADAQALNPKEKP